MSKATKFKYVAKEVLEEYPEPDAEHPVMKVLSSLGNNLHEVESPKGEKILASMPMKFRRNVWIKKGDYVIIEWIESITKVQADIMHILYTDQIRHLKQNNMWPPEFDDDDRGTAEIGADAAEKAPVVHSESAQGDGESDGEESESEPEEIFVNRNRQQRYMESASESGSESDIEDADEPDEEEESARSDA